MEQHFMEIYKNLVHIAGLSSSEIVENSFILQYSEVEMILHSSLKIVGNKRTL